MIPARVGVAVVLASGIEVEQEAICLSCGVIAAGAAAGALVRNDYRTRLLVGTRIGQVRDTAPRGFPLPAWTHPIIAARTPSVSNRMLTGWRSWHPNDLRKRVYAAMGLAPGASKVAPMLPGIPRLAFDRRVVSHVVRTPDDDHIRAAVLLPECLAEPDCVWMHDHDGKADQILFLKKFWDGSTEFTYLGVADWAEEFIRTGYRLSVNQKAEDLRYGRFLCARYAL
jgi:hypothetical protein